MSRTRPLVLETHEESASVSEGVWHPRHRQLTLGLILLITGPAFEGLAVATILPRIVANLGGLSLYGWSFSAYLLATIIGLILAGDEADRRGPAIPFIFGVSLFVLGLILAGTASSMLTFVLSRGVQGLGAGIIASVAYVCLGRGYPEQLKPQMIAILASAWVVPGLVGPALAGIVADAVGWRWVFLGLVPVLPLATILVLPALKNLAPSTTSGSWNPHRLFAASRPGNWGGNDPVGFTGTIRSSNHRDHALRTDSRDTVTASHSPRGYAESKSGYACRYRDNGSPQYGLLWR